MQQTIFDRISVGFILKVLRKPSEAIAHLGA